MHGRTLLRRAATAVRTRWVYRHISKMSSLKRRGFWWNTMVFTKTHVVGVFFTEAIVVTIGIVLSLAAFLVEDSLTVPLLLAAIVCILVAVTVLLASILSLLFFKGCDQTEPEARQ